MSQVACILDGRGVFSNFGFWRLICRVKSVVYAICKAAHGKETPCNNAEVAHLALHTNVHSDAQGAEADCADGIAALSALHSRKARE